MIMVPEAAVKFAVRDGDGVSGEWMGDRGVYNKMVSIKYDSR